MILAIADGIKSVDTNHLMTIELNSTVSESQDDPNWISRITANGVYTYYPTYHETLVAYNNPNIMPVLFLEEHYEYENVGGEFGTPNILRRQEYWSLTSGALAGHMYGNHYTWTFASGWQYLQTTGMRQFIKSFFSSRNWYNPMTWTFASGWQSHLTGQRPGKWSPCPTIPNSLTSAKHYPTTHMLLVLRLRNVCHLFCRRFCER